MSDFSVRLPFSEETIAPVTILDGQGSVVRVVPATEFRRTHGSAVGPRLSRPALGRRRRDESPERN